MKLIKSIILLLITINIQAQKAGSHPRIYAKNKERQAIILKIKNESWANASWNHLLKDIAPYVVKHQEDTEWIVSRLAMYWEAGKHYTQCYIKKQNWDYGEGNAPLPTVRLPGMRTWNDYRNVPLEDRIPYNKTGDMWGVSRSSSDKTPVLIPYKESGHMIRANNMEILRIAEKSAFAYWITEDEKYAKLSSDIFWTWMLGTYYMNPPLDPTKSTKGPGGYAPGGIMGYYDYEVIHDDRQEPIATIYDFIYDYLNKHPHKHLEDIGKSTTEVSGTVFKRFIEIGLVRGGKRGNWNVNRFSHMINSILVLESNDYYKDGKGREYYIPFYTEKSGDYHNALPNIMKTYDSVTGLWPESPGYASGMIPIVLEMGIKLYNNGINTLAGTPIIQKAALANLGWLDARGNLVVFGDMRGGPPNLSAFESLLTYYTLEKDTENANKVASVISKGIESGHYNRTKISFSGICSYQSIQKSDSELPFHHAAYSPFHRHIIMKNGNDVENGLMFTLYGGKSRSHLSKNGLAMQFYGKGWALAPDASAYVSYWSNDSGYHRDITGSNTIIPGYTVGDITMNAMDPLVDESKSFYNQIITSQNCSFADVSADEKRRLTAMVRTSATTGYYIDIFRSDLPDNDYIHHNLGNILRLKNRSGTELKLKNTDDLGTEYNSAYSFFDNQRKVKYNQDYLATWSITAKEPHLNIDMWMMGQENRELYYVDAPPTTLLTSVTPALVNKSPEPTPTLIVRQKNNNAKKSPFVAVFEPYNQGEKSIQSISKINTSDNFVSIAVSSKKSKQYICNAIDKRIYEPIKDLKFRGVFGIASEENNTFSYLYLGKGKLLQKGLYKIEAVDESISAALKFENGKYYYSSDKPIYITLKTGKAKQYPAGYNIEIKEVE